MFSDEDIKLHVDYWIKSSREKYKTMESLYKNKRYMDCLFFGHLILEKALKALVVKHTKTTAPYIHNLPLLAKKGELNLTEDEIKFLAKVNEFNIQTRYPDEKFMFYKLCDKAYTDQYYPKIISLYQKLCQLVK
ncbi:MAG: HEPN domain-containing protein [Parcubacteria group bacterium]|nr:HEPN domain-containing protein [Parcubacteria group bacterium]